VRNRQLIALIALISGLVALYLHLWKLGITGTLTCGGGGNCEYIMMSKYGWFLGVDVALIGTVGYALIFLASIWSLMPGWVDRREPALVLLVLIGGAVLFTVRLKYYEWFVLQGFCPWCFENVVAITLCAILIAREWRRVRALGNEPGEISSAPVSP